MPESVEFRAQLDTKSRYLAMAKAFKITDEHQVIREIDWYFATANGTTFKLKQQENFSQKEKSGYLITYNKVANDGVSVINSRMEPVELKDVSDRLAQYHSKFRFQGQVEKLRHEFLFTHKKSIVTIDLDRLLNVGDFFQVKVAIKDATKVDEAKWLGKRICFVFGIAPTDVFEAPVNYCDLLLPQEVHAQLEAFYAERKALLEQRRRMRLLQDTYQKYMDLMKRKESGVKLAIQRRRQWRRRMANARKVLRMKGVKAKEALKQAKRVNKAKKALRDEGRARKQKNGENNGDVEEVLAVIFRGEGARAQRAPARPITPPGGRAESEEEEGDASPN